MPEPAGYSTLDDAAAALLQRIAKLPEAESREYVGLLYQDPETGKYRFTEPAGGKSKNKARASFAVPPGSLRAIVHNHPTGGRENVSDAVTRFSADDVRMAKQLGVPSYIGVGNDLLRWHPDTGKMRRNQGVGESVLARIATDELTARR